MCIVPFAVGFSIVYAVRANINIIDTYFIGTTLGRGPHLHFIVFVSLFVVALKFIDFYSMYCVTFLKLKLPTYLFLCSLLCL